jgi:hypothetical protein
MSNTHSNWTQAQIAEVEACLAKVLASPMFAQAERQGGAQCDCQGFEFQVFHDRTPSQKLMESRRAFTPGTCDG